ncbi:hypothetical protein [Sphingobacterium sp. DR205]|uniref:hypothetical protein n=1 Tax=Sphingobacterium sp. DR205 TaxID=2713573 RepID=UPI0013E437ED|nr:hypothetical protein [Sphingobacterium sp. DR205]QIH32624.1 hypothetical protein G6053_06825 [Sphingobacterium sp. DR205]
MNMHKNSPRSTFTYDLRLFLYNFAMLLERDKFAIWELHPSMRRAVVGTASG